MELGPQETGGKWSAGPSMIGKEGKQSVSVISCCLPTVTRLGSGRQWCGCEDRPLLGEPAGAFVFCEGERRASEPPSGGQASVLHGPGPIWPHVEVKSLPCNTPGPFGCSRAVFSPDYYDMCRGRRR